MVNYGQLCTYLFFRRGHPGSAVFHCILQPLTLHICDGSLTALQPLTISAWFSAMAKQNQNPKKHKTKKPKSKKNKKTKKNKKKAQKNDKTQLSATTPPLGVCNLVFFWFVVFLFFGFLVSGSLLVFLQWLNKTKIQKNKKPKDQKNKQLQKNWQDPTLCHYSPLGVCNLGFFVFFVYLVFWFLVF